MRTEEAVQIERPDQMLIKQHEAGEDANEPQRGGVGGREPETVPAIGEAAEEFMEIVDQKLHRESLVNVPVQRTRNFCGSSSG